MRDRGLGWWLRTAVVGVILLVLTLVLSYWNDNKQDDDKQGLVVVSTR